jgi:hypothetical protein
VQCRQVTPKGGEGGGGEGLLFFFNDLGLGAHACMRAPLGYLILPAMWLWSVGPSPHKASCSCYWGSHWSNRTSPSQSHFLATAFARLTAVAD